MPTDKSRDLAGEEASMLEYDSTASETDDSWSAGHHRKYRTLRPSPRRHLRSSWRSALAAVGWCRILLCIPVLFLTVLGAVHLVHSYWYGDGLFWSAFDDDAEAFWPDWGNPGHVGEDIAHYPTDATRDVIPIPCHSHNDYWRRIPLFEAIHYGCTGVEADVWLKHDTLFVGHSTPSLTRNRTFTSMYVDPLVDLLDKQNPTTEFATVSGAGVFDESPGQTLVLLVDFKTEGEETWPVVVEQLSALRDKGYLSYWNGTDTIYRAVTVVATGNAPYNLVVANQTYRDVFFDAPIQSLTDGTLDANQPRGSGQGQTGTENTNGASFNTGNSYYASVSLLDAVGPIHHLGRFSNPQLEIIRDQIAAAKKAGLKSRYWDTPAWPVSLRNYVWQTLIQEGAEVLNVDDLRSAAKIDWRRREHNVL